MQSGQNDLRKGNTMEEVNTLPIVSFSHFKWGKNKEL